MPESAFPFFDAFPFPVDITNARNQLVYINRAFQKFYGYGPEILGLTPHFLLPPEFDRSRLIENLHALSDNQRIFTGAQVNLTAKGDPIEVFLLGFPLGVIPGANPVGFIYVACEPGRKDEMILELVRVTLASTLLGGGFPGFDGAVAARRGDRQRAIMKLADLGYTTKQIATMMGISVSTVGYVRWKMARSPVRPDAGSADRSLLARALSRRSRSQ